jgi:polar amino acid transport system substrate-binding protein
MVVLAVCMFARSWAQTPSEVVIAAEDDWPPYSSVGPSNAEPTGFAVTLVREAFATQSIRVRFITVPFARCMFLAKIGKVAGCFNATILDENRDLYYWSKSPMFREELAIFARAGTAQSNVTLEDLAGKRVGYTIEYTYPAAFSLNQRILKFGAKSDQVLLEMLLAGHLDYIIVNTMPAYVQMKKMGKSAALFAKAGVISEDGFWVAFTRAQPAGATLAEQFERGLQTLHQSGRYQQLRDQLMPGGFKQGPAQ